MDNPFLHRMIVSSWELKESKIQNAIPNSIPNAIPNAMPNKVLNAIEDPSKNQSIVDKPVSN